jgi:hypothetical protein
MENMLSGASEIDTRVYYADQALRSNVKRFVKANFQLRIERSTVKNEHAEIRNLQTLSG